MRRIEILIDDLCTEIDRLEHKLDKANEEANYWRDRYQAALNEAVIRHNETMMSTALTALLAQEEK